MVGSTPRPGWCLQQSAPQPARVRKRCTSTALRIWGKGHRLADTRRSLVSGWARPGPPRLWILDPGNVPSTTRRQHAPALQTSAADTVHAGAAAACIAEELSDCGRAQSSAAAARRAAMTRAQTHPRGSGDRAATVDLVRAADDDGVDKSVEHLVDGHHDRRTGYGSCYLGLHDSPGRLSWLHGLVCIEARDETVLDAACALAPQHRRGRGSGDPRWATHLRR